MLTSEGIRNHEVNLGAIEGRFAFLLKVVKLISNNCVLELLLRALPQFFRSQIGITIIAVR